MTLEKWLVITQMGVIAPFLIRVRRRLQTAFLTTSASCVDATTRPPLRDVALDAERFGSRASGPRHVPVMKIGHDGTSARRTGDGDPWKRVALFFFSHSPSSWMFQTRFGAWTIWVVNKQVRHFCFANLLRK